MQSWCSGFRLADGAAVIADRGYDSRRNNDYAHRSGGIPVIHKRRPPGGRRREGIYTTDGVPTGLGRVEMEYVRTDPDTGHRRYRCPAGGGAWRERFQGCAVCGDAAWQTPGRNLRWFSGRIWSSGVSMRRQQPGGERSQRREQRLSGGRSRAIIMRPAAQRFARLGAVPML